MVSGMNFTHHISKGFRGLGGGYSFALTHTMAHELGHGLFGLDHIFSGAYGIKKGATYNLMDDWPTNFRQGLTGLDSEQYLKTIKNALIIDEYLKDKPLCFVGHSLGGGLATVNAIATGRCAVTFNPAGIKQSTLDRVNVEDPESLVTNYVVRGEVLNEYINNKQGDLFDWGSYFGKIIYVNPKCEGGSSIDKHGMCHFLNNQYYSECLKKQCREYLKYQYSECLKYQCSECLNECE